jgi:hypothetical protein
MFAGAYIHIKIGLGFVVFLMGLAQNPGPIALWLLVYFIKVCMYVPEEFKV